MVEEEVEMENEDGTLKDAESKEELVEALKRMAEALGMKVTGKEDVGRNEKYCPDCGELEKECYCENEDDKKSIVIAIGKK